MDVAPVVNCTATDVLPALPAGVASSAEITICAKLLRGHRNALFAKTDAF